MRIIYLLAIAKCAGYARLVNGILPSNGLASIWWTLPVVKDSIHPKMAARAWTHVANWQR
jgi:hypothetical protein